MKIRIDNGWLVPIDGRQDIVENGAVVVDGGRVVGVGSTEDMRAQHPDADIVLDASGKAVLPGLVNTHTHLIGALNKGITEDYKSTSGGLFRLALPMHDNFVRREDFYWPAMIHGLEMLKTGTTTINETWWFQDQAARCVEDLGLRAVLAPMIREVGFEQLAPTNDTRVWDRDLGKSSLDEAARDIETWNGAADGRITCRVAPFSPDTCSEQLLEKSLELAAKHDLGYHVHLAQIPGEVEFMNKAYDRGSVEFMHDMGFLTERFIGAHCVFITPDEIDMMAAARAHISHTAYLVAKRAYFPPMPDVYAQNVPVSMGSDWCSNDLFQTMKMAIALARHQAGDTTLVDAGAVLRMATMGGAEALGMQDEIGSLEPGKKADIFMLDLQTPWCSPIRKENLVTNIVYNASGGDVTDVIVDGKVRMRDRSLPELDEAMVLRKGQEVANTVWERAHELF